MDPILTAQTEQMARELATQASTIDELNGLLRGLMKSALQRMLDTEMDVHLGRKELPVPLDGAAGSPPPPDAPRNRRNGRSKKTVQGVRHQRVPDPVPTLPLTVAAPA
jgi:putative transposase